MGKYERNRALWLYRTEPGRWLTAFLVSLGILLTVFLLKRPVFMTIDDARLNYVYAGYSTGQPVSTYLFCYYPLSLVLSTLYKLFPAVPWYALYQFGVIGLSCTLIGKTLYRLCWRRQVPFLLSIALHVGLYLTLGLVSTILMHFEITAALASTAGIVVLLGMDFKNDSLALKITDGLTAAFFIVLSYIIQFNAFYGACCYLLVAAVVIIGKAIQEGTLRKTLLWFLGLLAVLGVLVGAVIISDDISKDTPQWDAYMEYNKYRVSFWDYPHIDYADDPELFEEMGWSGEFYDLTQSMYFMDSRFSKENLEQFTTRFSWFDFKDFNTMVTTADNTLTSLFTNETVARFQAGVLVMLLCVIPLCFSRRRWKAQYPLLLGMLCCLGGTLVLTLFLASKGRLPLRAWMAFAMPAIAVVVMLLLRGFNGSLSPDRLNVLPRRSFVAGCFCALWLVGITGAYEKVVENDWVWRNNHNQNTLMMEEYVASRPDCVYVYDLVGAQNYHVFSLYPDPGHRPNNAFVWGSSYLFTPAYEEQLAANGLDQLLTEDLFRDNVYFITAANQGYMHRLVTMLQADYENVGFQPVDYIGQRFVVYKFYDQRTGLPGA